MLVVASVPLGSRWIPLVSIGRTLIWDAEVHLTFCHLESNKFHPLGLLVLRLFCTALSGDCHPTMPNDRGLLQSSSISGSLVPSFLFNFFLLCPHPGFSSSSLWFLVLSDRDPLGHSAFVSRRSLPRSLLTDFTLHVSTSQLNFLSLSFTLFVQQLTPLRLSNLQTYLSGPFDLPLRTSLLYRSN